MTTNDTNKTQVLDTKTTAATDATQVIPEKERPAAADARAAAATQTLPPTGGVAGTTATTGDSTTGDSAQTAAGAKPAWASAQQPAYQPIGDQSRYAGYAGAPAGNGTGSTGTFAQSAGYPGTGAGTGANTAAPNGFAASGAPQAPYAPGAPAGATPANGVPGTPGTDAPGAPGDGKAKHPKLGGKTVAIIAGVTLVCGLLGGIAGGAVVNAFSDSGRGDGTSQMGQMPGGSSNDYGQGGGQGGQMGEPPSGGMGPGGNSNGQGGSSNGDSDSSGSGSGSSGSSSSGSSSSSSDTESGSTTSGDSIAS